MTDAEYVARAYELILRRAPDPDGLAAATGAIESRAVSRTGFVHGLVQSPEFDELRHLEDALLRASEGPLRELHAAPGSDERRIEIPWVLSRYRGERRVLDVGHAHAPPGYLDALVALGAAELVGVDLVDQDVAGLRSVVGDLRALPFGDASFELVHCISTLEHVGWDNSVYGQAAERDAGGMEVALGELRRVLTRDGRLLITVPCGVAEHHGWFVQQPSREWLALFARHGLSADEFEVYELGPGGWGSVHGEPLVRYGERGPAASAVLCAQLRPGTGP